MKQELQKVFGENLRFQRRTAKMTLEQVATKGEIALRYVQDLEAGRKMPSIITLSKLCWALGVNSDTLMSPVLDTQEKLKRAT